MNIIIVHGFAHCLKNVNSLYSATVETLGGTSHKKINNDYKIRGEKEMNMTGAEKEEIRSTLIRFSLIFEDPEYRLPYNEPVNQEALANAAATVL